MSLAQPLTPGTTVAQEYRVERLLARGGMGTLYIVTQLSTGHERVLKVMHARFLHDTRTRERFLQEARVNSRIESDHVVQVIAAGFDESGIPWMVMESLRGEDLAAAVERRGAFPPAEAMEVFRQFGHALGAAHKAGLVHRDLKPENIFLAVSRREGVPFTIKLLDFGIAKVLAEAAPTDKATGAVGTPLWMAPEQAGKGEISPAADVWSMGLVAFYLLTGKFYWLAGNAPEVTFERILRELFMDAIEPASARAAKLGVTVPQGFDAWFARCVQREAAQRFPNATEALNALVPVLAQAPATSAPALNPAAVATLQPTRPSDALHESQKLPAGAYAAPMNNPFVTPASGPSPFHGVAASSPAPFQPPAPVAPPPEPAQPRTIAWSPGDASSLNAIQSSQPAWPPPVTGPAPFSAQSSSPGVPPGPPPSWQTQIHPPPKKPSYGLWVLVGVGLGLLGFAGFLGVWYLRDEPAPRRNAPPVRGDGSTARVTRTVAAGSGHTCARAADGTVRCWGWNQFGQLGDGTFTSRRSPVTVQGLSGVVEVAAGHAHSCARLVDGSVRCWGLNSSGQLGDGTSVNRNAPVVVSGAQGAAQLALGEGHTCARMIDATVRCWGANAHGQLGDGTNLNRATVAAVTALTYVTDIAAGNEHTCARRSDGTVYCWGAANFGQAGDGHLQDHRYATAVPGAAGAAGVALGPYRSCARMANGTLQCWGRNDAGQLADGTHVSRSTPLPIRAIPSGVADVIVGSFHTCARMTDETARCWGSGASGRLGDGTGANQASPVAVQGLASALELSAYDGHTCARTRDGAVRCWGQNTYGQIGDGSTTDRTAPVVVTLR